jgi:hypothetical protein
MRLVWVERRQCSLLAWDVIDASSAFPELENFEDAEFATHGYNPSWLSVFDHWLTEDEAGSSNLMSYSLAKKSGSIAIYLEQEERFVRFYADLLKGQDWRDANAPELLRTGLDDGALEQIVRPSLRERERMDIYLCDRCLRIMGGYDRTDLFLFEDDAMIAQTEVLARGHGLFLLR